MSNAEIHQTRHDTSSLSFSGIRSRDKDTCEKKNEVERNKSKFSSEVDAVLSKYKRKKYIREDDLLQEIMMLAHPEGKESCMLSNNQKRRLESLAPQDAPLVDPISLLLDRVENAHVSQMTRDTMARLAMLTHRMTPIQSKRYRSQGI